MQNPTQVENLRESYRFPIDESRRGSQLRVGEEWTPVELLDESAGGFGVKADGPLDVSVGAIVQLRMGKECFEARVMNVAEQTPGDGEGAPSLRLGLKREGEVFADTVERQPWYAFLRKPQRYRPFSSTGKMLCAALIFAFLVGAAPAIIIYFFDSRGIGASAIGAHSGANSGEEIQPWKKNGKLAESQFAGNPLIINDGEPDHNISARRFPDLGLFGDKTPSNQQPLNHKRDEGFELLLNYSKLKGKIGAWSHEALAVISGLVEKLGLSDPQKQKVDVLLKQTDEKIARLDEPNPENTPQKVAVEKTSILEAAYANLMQIFTKAQRIQWIELVKQWSEEKGDSNTRLDKSE